MTTDDLFPHIAAPAPALELARRRLADAAAKLDDAEAWLDEQGPEAAPALMQAKEAHRKAQAEVIRLERLAMGLGD